MVKKPVLNYRDIFGYSYFQVNNIGIFLDKFALECRDPYMAESVSKCYDKAIENDVNVEVIIGDAHLSEQSKFVDIIKELLSKNG